MTSLYFTCLANGNSRMYSSREMERMVAAAGLELQRTVPDLGICQCLMIFTRGLGKLGDAPAAAVVML